MTKFGKTSVIYVYVVFILIGEKIKACLIAICLRYNIILFVFNVNPYYVKYKKIAYSENFKPDSLQWQTKGNNNKDFKGK